MTTNDTAAALETAVDAAIGAWVRMQRGGYTPADESASDAARAALRRTITTCVAAEVARRLKAAPEIEEAIRAVQLRSFEYGGASDARPVEASYDALRTAIAADKVRAVTLAVAETRRGDCARCSGDPDSACPDSCIDCAIIAGKSHDEIMTIANRRRKDHV